MIAKSLSIKDAKRKFGGCAPKAVGFISGGLHRVRQSGLSVPRGTLTAMQKSAEGIVRRKQRKARTVWSGK